MPSLSGAAAVSAILIAIVVISIESRAGNNAVTRQAVRFPVLSAATKASRISISDGGDGNMTQTQAPRGHTEQEQLESPMPTHPPRTSPPPPKLTPPPTSLPTSTLALPHGAPKSRHRGELGPESKIPKVVWQTYVCSWSASTSDHQLPRLVLLHAFRR